MLGNFRSSLPYYWRMKHFFTLSILILIACLTGCTLPLPPEPVVPKQCQEPKSIPGCLGGWRTPELDCCNLDKLDCRTLTGGLLCFTVGTCPLRCPSDAEERCFEELLCCAKEGDVNAQASLGRKFLIGKGAPFNPQMGVYWFKQSAERGCAYAQYQMGNFYRDGIVVRKDFQQAICWYEKAAYQNDVTAMLALGDMYGGRFGVVPCYEKALRWYQCATERGSSEAKIRMSAIWVRGHCGPNNVARGMDILTEEAEMGNKDALVILGDVYYEGLLGCPDYCRAKEYYKIAADKCSPEAAFKLAMLSEMGLGVPKNAAKAAEWLSTSAEGGYPMAELRVADIYRDGWVFKEIMKEQPIGMK